MGKLAAALNQSIREMEGDEMTRSQIVAKMGNAAGIEANTVNQILDGSIGCPPIGRLRAFARALDMSLNTLTAAARQDGCNYE